MSAHKQVVSVDQRISEYGPGGEPAYPLGAQTHTMEWRGSRKGQAVGVGVVDTRKTGPDGRPQGPNIIIPCAYAEVLESFSAQRGVRIAETLAALGIGDGARVFIVEMPGVGMVAKPMKFLQAMGLLRGRFDRVGAASTKALLDTGLLKRGDEASILGYSQGVSLGVELMAGLDKVGVQVTNFLTIDAVGNQNFELTDLLRRIAAEDKETDRFLGMNRSYGVGGRRIFVEPIDRKVQSLEKAAKYAERRGQTLPETEDPLWTYERDFERRRYPWRARPSVLLGGFALASSVGRMIKTGGKLNERLVEVIYDSRNLHVTKFTFTDFDQSGMSSSDKNEATARLVAEAQEARRLQLVRELGREVGYAMVNLGIDAAMPHAKRLREAEQQSTPEPFVITWTAPEGLRHPAWHSMPLVDFITRSLKALGRI